MMNNDPRPIDVFGCSSRGLLSCPSSRVGRPQTSVRHYNFFGGCHSSCVPMSPLRLRRRLLRCVVSPLPSHLCCEMIVSCDGRTNEGWARLCASYRSHRHNLRLPSHDRANDQSSTIGSLLPASRRLRSRSCSRAGQLQTVRRLGLYCGCHMLAAVVSLRLRRRLLRCVVSPLPSHVC